MKAKKIQLLSATVNNPIFTEKQKIMIKSRNLVID